MSGFFNFIFSLVRSIHYMSIQLLWWCCCCCFPPHGAIINSTTVNIFVQVLGCVSVFLLCIDWERKVSGSWYICMSNFLRYCLKVVQIYTPSSGIQGFSRHSIDDESFKFSHASLLCFKYTCYWWLTLWGTILCDQVISYPLFWKVKILCLFFF